MTGTNTELNNPVTEATAESATDVVNETELSEDQQAQEIWNELEAADNGEEVSRAELTRDEEPPADLEAEAVETAPQAAEVEVPAPSVANATDAQTPDLATENARLQKELGELKGRFSGQGRKIQSLIAERDRLQGQISEAQSLTSEEDKQAMDQAAADYGDIISPVAKQMTALEKQVDVLTGDRTARVEELDGEISDRLAEEGQKLLEAHPDFNQVASQNKELLDRWIQDQPKALRDAYEVNSQHIVDAEGASMVMTNFKAALAAASEGSDPTPPPSNKQAKRDRQMAGAQAAPGRSQPATTNTVDPNSPDRQAHWDEFEERDQRRSRR